MLLPPPIILGPIDFTCPLSSMAVEAVLEECEFYDYVAGFNSIKHKFDASPSIYYIRLGFKLHGWRFNDKFGFAEEVEVYNEEIENDSAIKIYTLEELQEKFKKHEPNS